MRYKCPKCNNTMAVISTASIPPITLYECFNCGYKSKPIKQEYKEIVLPKEFRPEEDNTDKDYKPEEDNADKD